MFGGYFNQQQQQQHRPSTALFSAQSSPRVSGVMQPFNSNGGMGGANVNYYTPEDQLSRMMMSLNAAEAHTANINNCNNLLQQMQMLSHNNNNNTNNNNNYNNNTPAYPLYSPVTPTLGMYAPSSGSGSGPSQDHSGLVQCMQSFLHICATQHEQLQQDEPFFSAMGELERILQAELTAAIAAQNHLPGNGMNTNQSADSELQQAQHLVSTVTALGERLAQCERDHRQVLKRYIFEQNSQRKATEELLSAARPLQQFVNNNNVNIASNVNLTKMVEDIAERQECIRQQLIDELLLQRRDLLLVSIPIDEEEADTLFASPQLHNTNDNNNNNDHSSDNNNDKENNNDTNTNTVLSRHSSVELTSVIASRSRHAHFQMYECAARYIQALKAAVHQGAAAAALNVNTNQYYYNNNIRNEAVMAMLSALTAQLTLCKQSMNNCARRHAAVRKQLLEVLHQRLHDDDVNRKQREESTVARDSSASATGGMDGRPNHAMGSEGPPPVRSTVAPPQMTQPQPQLPRASDVFRAMIQSIDGDATATSSTHLNTAAAAAAASDTGAACAPENDGESRSVARSSAEQHTNAVVSRRRDRAQRDEEDSALGEVVSPLTASNSSPPSLASECTHGTATASDKVVTAAVDPSKEEARIDIAVHHEVVRVTQHRVASSGLGAAIAGSMKGAESEDDDEDAEAQRYGLGHEGGGFFRGIAAFAKAVVRRALDFGDDDDEGDDCSDGGELSRKRRRVEH